MSPRLTETPPVVNNGACAAFPWHENSARESDAIWRYELNPVIARNPLPTVARIYNSAVIPFNGRYTGVFRADYHNGMPYLHVGWSDNGLNWKFEPNQISFQSVPGGSALEYAYDPRVCRIEDEYFVIWCNGYHGPTIGLARTTDFTRFEQLENAFLPCNRNGVLFPRKIKGRYAILSRPSDQGHTPFGDIFYSESPDLRHWGGHRFVMGPGKQWWQGKKIGAGPVPIETSEGWLIFYHGVCSTCSGFIYSMGVALLDLDQPWKVRYRSNRYLLTPEKPCETIGHVPNVVFPCSALHDGPTGRLAIYYGAADTYTALAFSRVDLIFDFLRKNSEI
jgi:beta-1,4-mannooligosaccharide/beta-1,4-mannosyl-N-acetylglucosamine phosphorylase